MKDTWRAILVIAVVTILRHEEAVWQAAQRAVSPSVETTVAWRPAPAPAPQQTWHPAPQTYMPPQYPVYGNQQRGPLRKIGAEAVDFAEALIGVVRR
jgi:hypothetical protein